MTERLKKARRSRINTGKYQQIQTKKQNREAWEKKIAEILEVNTGICSLSITQREHIYTGEDQFMEFVPPYGFERRRWLWAVIGAETGNQKTKVTPEKARIDEIVKVCDRFGTPVFMKDSLLSIMGEENMRREFPRETEE